MVREIRDKTITFRLPGELRNRLEVLAEYLYDGNLSDTINEILEREVKKYEGTNNV